MHQPQFMFMITCVASGGIQNLKKIKVDHCTFGVATHCRDMPECYSACSDLHLMSNAWHGKAYWAHLAC